MTLSSAREIFDKMPQGFQADAADGVDMVFQFHITGAGDWNVAVKDGTCTVSEGVHESPTVALTMSEENWIALVAGQLNPAMAFMSGKIKASGDLFAAQKFGALFKVK